jgi:hypothetical protein
MQVIRISNYASCPHITFKCFARSVQWTANISLNKLVCICNVEVCFLWRRHWNLKYYSDQHIRSFLAREPLCMATIISAINGVRRNQLHFNYITTLEGNNIKMKYSSVWRPPMCLYYVHILLPTPHKHLKKGVKIVAGYATAEDIQKGTVFTTLHHLQTPVHPDTLIWP